MGYDQSVIIECIDCGNLSEVPKHLFVDYDYCDKCRDFTTHKINMVETRKEFAK